MSVIRAYLPMVVMIVVIVVASLWLSDRMLAEQFADRGTCLRALTPGCENAE